MSIVNLTLEGFLAKDPDVKFSAAGKPMANLSIAHNQGKKEEGKPPIWFNLKAVGAAGAMFEHASKGDKVKIIEAVPEEWVDKSGNKRLSWVVFKAEVTAGTPRQQPPSQPEESAFDDESIPF